MTQDLRNVIVIGSGPAGYTAAIYLGRAGLNPLVIAGTLTPGGQLVNTTQVENYPGFPDGVLGPDLMDKMRKQAERFGATIIYDDVTSVDLTGNVKKLTTDSGDNFSARAVIVATGSAYRKLGVPGEAEYSGKGVSYCATCDGFFFKNRPIVVIGGGDSAMEDATFLTRFGSSVTVVHRRDTFRASAIMVRRAKADPKITFRFNSVTTRIDGDDHGVNHVELRNTATGETSRIEAQGVFVAIGITPQTAFLHGTLPVDGGGYIRTVGTSCATPVAGVFAAGDVVDSVYRQAVSAAGTGCRAALDAQGYLDSRRDG